MSDTVQSRLAASLKHDFTGDLVLPTDQTYDDARRVWNAAIDKHPKAIVRCTTTQEVSRTVRFAHDEGCALAIRGGGHNIAGSALCDDGIVVDLSRMKSVEVDPEKRRAIVEGGATLGEFDAAAQAHALATPLGINSTTGVAGLTLGGGFGWLSRKYGMTVDNLLSAQVVTAEGQVLHADAKEYPDLFWALRGGGGNFGVVTRFEFGLHSVGPDLLSGLIVYPAGQADTVLPQYREFIEQAPDELSVWLLMRKAPPLPFLPPEIHGTSIIGLGLLYAGPPEQGEALIAPLRKLGTPVGEHVGVQPYAAWQKAFDPLLAPGARNYWKSLNFLALTNGVFDAALKSLDTMPSPQCEIFAAVLGGAASRPPPDATAYAHRDTRFIINVHGRWESPQDDEQCIAWAREFFRAASPFAAPGVYVNFMTAEELDRVRSAYAGNYGHLAEIKRLYDPSNLFRSNQNIAPN